MENPSLSSPASLGPTAKRTRVGSAHGLARGQPGSFGQGPHSGLGIYRDPGLSPRADVGAW